VKYNIQFFSQSEQSTKSFQENIFSVFEFPASASPLDVNHALKLPRRSLTKALDHATLRTVKWYIGKEDFMDYRCR
jgi:hypothetical protein